MFKLSVLELCVQEGALAGQLELKWGIGQGSQGALHKECLGRIAVAKVGTS